MPSYESLTDKSWQDSGSFSRVSVNTCAFSMQTKKRLSVSVLSGIISGMPLHMAEF